MPTFGEVKHIAQSCQELREQRSLPREHALSNMSDKRPKERKEDQFALAIKRFSSLHVVKCAICAQAAQKNSSFFISSENASCFLLTSSGRLRFAKKNC